MSPANWRAAARLYWKAATPGWRATTRSNRARPLLDEAEALAPKDALTLDTLGVARTRVGDLDEGRALFERVVALQPGVAAFQYNLA
ncbi:MAG: hypothetical protein EON88_29070, partial [Brevundimonas sp.]